MKKKILLADDSITIQKIVRIELSAGGSYELTTTDNGVDALAMARKNPPDLMVIDTVMPGKDGYRVCEEFKADPTLKNIPVLLLASPAEGFDETKAMKSGADGYIIKPFESSAFIREVEKALAKAGSR